MTHTNDPNTTPPPQRHLTVVGLVVVVVVYLVVIQGLGVLLHQLAHSDAPYGEFPDELSILYGIIVPVGLSILFVLGVVAWLGWQRDVFVDGLPTRKWVWIVPAILVATALVVTDYGNLADIGGAFVLTLALGSLLVGVGEEIMFRGLGIATFRKNGFSRGAGGALVVDPVRRGTPLEHLPRGPRRADAGTHRLGERLLLLPVPARVRWSARADPVPRGVGLLVVLGAGRRRS